MPQARARRIDTTNLVAGYPNTEKRASRDDWMLVRVPRRHRFQRFRRPQSFILMTKRIAAFAEFFAAQESGLAQRCSL